MEKKITSFKISFIKNIGEISEKKDEMFTNEFNKEFPIKNEIPQGILLTKQANNFIKSLLITPNQVTYSQDGDIVDIDFDEPKIAIKNIYDKLFLNYKCSVIYNFACLIDGKEHPNVLADKLSLDIKVDGVKGVGIKVFLDNEKQVGVLAFEPYLKDLDKYFCSLELQYKKQSDVNEVIECAKDEALQLFYKLIDDIYNKL